MSRAVEDRVAGGLVGVAAGDALGSTLEFLTAEQVRERHGRHTELTGGGAFGWRPGQGTDDTDLTYAVARAYAGGYSLQRVAANFLDWIAGDPRDVGGTTRAALEVLGRDGDPRRSGEAALGPQSAGNGALMRALPTALARPDPAQRRQEAGEIAAVTHADPRCTDASVAYCDVAAALLDGATPADAVAGVLAGSPVGEPVRAALDAATRLALPALRPTGYVLDSLTVAVWAVLQPNPLEPVLIDVVNLGGDADTTGAIAGGLLGARDGLTAIPHRWRTRLEYEPRLLELVPAFIQLRGATAT